MSASPQHELPRGSLADVETPIGVVDLQTARANARRVVEHLRAHGIAWRPHVKTHKCVRMARVQLAAGAQGLTVATPREAEVMATVTDDLLLAYPVVGRSKLDRLMALPQRVDLKVGLDSSEVLDGLARASVAANRESGVLIEIDVGSRRVGLGSPDGVVALAHETTQREGVTYRGIMFYPGHIRQHLEDQRADLTRLADRLRSFVEALEKEGLPPEMVSGGSTPTLWLSHEVPGLTEVRAGTALFQDREQVDLGAARVEDLAYSVLATVVSTSVPGQAVVDAGSKALAKEAPRGDSGYGTLLDRPEVSVRDLSEEHGMLDLTHSAWQPTVGDRVRIVPNHVCVSVNLQDHLLVLDDGHGEMWPLEGRGRRPYRPGPGV